MDTYASIRSLYSTFITPWSDSSAAHSVEPDFHLPACYQVSHPPPGPQKAQAFSDETLFYMFYASPRDALQEVAAFELCVSPLVFFLFWLCSVFDRVTCVKFSELITSNLYVPLFLDLTEIGDSTRTCDFGLRKSRAHRLLKRSSVVNEEHTRTGIRRTGKRTARR